MSREEIPADENFLSRWSRRKLEGESDAELNSGQSLQPHETLSESHNEEPPHLTDEDMPPIESLTDDSDYTGFMSPGVSEELRQMALRKLFGSTAFNVVDGLDDYDEDFTSFTKLGDFVTADMRFQMEQEARRKMDALLADDESAEIIEQGTSDVGLQEDQLVAAEDAAEPVEPDMNEQIETEQVITAVDDTRKTT